MEGLYGDIVDCHQGQNKGVRPDHIQSLQYAKKENSVLDRFETSLISHPLCLLTILDFWHFLPQPIGVDQSPL